MDFLNKQRPFDDVKHHLESNGLIVKQYKKYPTLYMVHYKHGDDEVREAWPMCRGLILEKETNKVVCYTLDRIWRTETLANINEQHCQQSIDGIQIKLFYYDDKWNVATTRCIDIEYSKWANGSFADLFADVRPSIDFERLNKSHCYSLVLQHPKNRIVCRIENPALFHIMTRSLDTLAEVQGDDIGLPRPATLDPIALSPDCDDLKTEGIIIIDEAGQRYKYVYPEYDRIKGIKGNQFDLFYRYLQLWKDDNTTEYLTEFPEDTEKLRAYKDRLLTMCGRLHRNYLECFVWRPPRRVPKPIHKYLCQIHAEYMSERTPRTAEKVQAFVRTLHPSQVYFLCKRLYPPE